MLKNHMKFGRLAPLALGNARGGGTVVDRVWRFWPARLCGKGKGFWPHQWRNLAQKICLRWFHRPGNDSTPLNKAV